MVVSSDLYGEGIDVSLDLYSWAYSAAISRTITTSSSITVRRESRFIMPSPDPVARTSLSHLLSIAMHYSVQSSQTLDLCRCESVCEGLETLQ